MRSKIGLLAVGLGLATMPSLGNASENLGDAPGFQAHSVTYAEGEEAESVVEVYMAPEGRRLEGVPPHDLTVISPSGADKRWLLDSEGRRYAVDSSVSKGSTLGGVLAHEPCKGFSEAKKLGEVSFNERDVGKWECHHPSYGKVVQWFDPTINTVIRDRTANGKIQELRDIRVGAQDPGKFRFEASGDFEEVPVIELFKP